MNEHTIMAAIAAVDCWRDAGFEVPDEKSSEVDADTGLILGTVMAAPELADVFIPLVNGGNTRRLGSSMGERMMCSSAAATVSGLLALAGEVSMNSNAGATGAQSVIDGWQKIRSGSIKRMLVGASEGSSYYSWAPLDALRILARDSNDAPEKASRPMSASARAFVPGSAAGMILLESLDSALARNATIYAEILAGFQNCGGQRNGGTMTLANPSMAQMCIKKCLCLAGVKAQERQVRISH
jgi:3-oxoacyl-(acyl-carrier-protein) synthase